MKAYNWLTLASGIALTTLVAILCMGWGAEPLNLLDLGDKNSIAFRIFFELRLPRLLLVALTGGCLAILGATFQVLFHNPLAEPYVLGISSAVTLGIVIAETFLFGMGTGVGISFGLLMALGLSGLIVLWSLSYRGRDLERLLLFGMGLNFVLSSCVFLLLSYVQRQVGGGSLRFLFGQVPWPTYREVAWFTLSTVPLASFLWLSGRKLDALSLGDIVARSLGTNPGRSRAILLGVSSLLTACLVAQVGSIGFVGLVVPNFCRRLFQTPNHRSLLGISFFVGAIFLSLSDLLSRILLPPIEFPLGILTTLIGGPLFLWVLWKR